MGLPVGLVAAIQRAADVDGFVLCSTGGRCAAQRRGDGVRCRPASSTTLGKGRRQGKAVSGYDVAPRSCRCSAQAGRPLSALVMGVMVMVCASRLLEAGPTRWARGGYVASSLAQNRR